MRHSLAAVALATLAGACSVGAPPGFAEGDRWVIPLIGPLEDQLLLVPALVNDKGPFVFAIDPDAPVSVIDEDVLNATGAHTGEGPRLLDESDTQRNRFYAEILSWQLGTLTVKGPMPAEVVGKGTFDADGRRIHGVIGRDIVADSLVFSFDRDAGVAVLSTQKAFSAPSKATALSYSKLQSQIENVETLPLPRRLVNATIGNAKVAMHVDLGATASQLRPRSWAKAGLVTSAASLTAVDEVGILHPIKEQGVASAVSVRDVTSKDVVFVPFVDKRWPDQDVEGALGLNFFKPYRVTVNWDSDKLYLWPRSGLQNVLQRISRWQSRTLAACKDAGCAKVTLIDPLAGRAPEMMPEKHPGVVASIVRDPSAKHLDLELLVAVTPAPGKGPLQWLVANLPAGTDRAMTHLSADYVGATLTVLDASPFPRACPAQGACVDRIPAPQAFAPDASAPQTLPASAVKRRAGEPMIVPDDETKVGLNGATLQASAKICVDATGKVEDVRMLASSGIASYDETIMRTIRSTWSYEPYLFEGKPIPFCTTQTFIYTQR